MSNIDNGRPAQSTTATAGDLAERLAARWNRAAMKVEARNTTGKSTTSEDRKAA